MLSSTFCHFSSWFEVPNLYMLVATRENYILSLVATYVIYVKLCMYIRYLLRFFDHWAHETTYAYIGNKHFFTKSCQCQAYQNSKISWQKMCLILLIKGFKNWSFQKMPITIYVPLNWYSSMKKKFRKIRIIFDIENSLWKSEIGIFCQLILEFW